MKALGPLSSFVKSSVRNLRVSLDSAFTLDLHVRSLVDSCFYHLRNIARLSTIVSCSKLEIVIHAFISSMFEPYVSLFSSCLFRFLPCLCLPTTLSIVSCLRCMSLSCTLCLGLPHPLCVWVMFLLPLSRVPSLPLSGCHVCLTSTLVSSSRVPVYVSLCFLFYFDSLMFPVQCV